MSSRFATPAFTGKSFRRLRFAMKLATAHQPTGYVRRLQQRALSRKMGGQIPRDGNKNMPALVAVLAAQARPRHLSYNLFHLLPALK